MYHHEEYYAFRAKINDNFQNIQKPKLQILNANHSDEKWVTQQHFRSKVQTMQMLQVATGLNNAEKGVEIKRQKTQQELRYIIDMAMRFQQIIIELGESVSRASSLALLFIFFKAGLAMIFNAYNMVVFFLRLANNLDEQHLGVATTLVYHGYHIFCAALDVLLTIIGFTMVYNQIENTTRVLSKLNLYVTDEILRSRLQQFAALIANNLRKYTHFGLYNLDGSFIWAIVSGITTYIIILVQYGIKDSGEEQSILR